MDNRPIGFFDSGLGGLTCIPHLVRELPEERVVYFGDTARTPYGSKTEATIRNFSLEIAGFLVENNVKMIVIACNTVSSVALFEISEKYPEIPVIGIIQPAADKIVKMCTACDRVGIIGTKATVRSGSYDKALLSLNGNFHFFSEACPVLVPLIEEGIIESDIMDLSIKYYLDGFIEKNEINVIVLGCTHYPLIRRNIEKLYPGLKIIDPSIEIISEIKKTLVEREMFAKGSGLLNTFYASDLSPHFLGMIDRIFEDTSVNVIFKNLEL